MNKKQDNQGMALIIVLVLVVVMIPLGLALVYLMRPETKFTMDSKKATQTGFMAEAGVNRVKTDLIIKLFRDLVNESITAAQLEDYATSGSTGAIVFLHEKALFNIDASSSTAFLQFSDTSPAKGYNSRVDVSTATATNWDSVAKTARFFYKYQITSTGWVGNRQKTLVLDSRDYGGENDNLRQGIFEVPVSNSFAQWLLFTNQQRNKPLPGKALGTQIWFTAGVTFDGPMFTNDKFYFANIYGGAGDQFTNNLYCVSLKCGFKNEVPASSPIQWYGNLEADPSKKEMMINENGDPTGWYIHLLEQDSTLTDIPDFAAGKGLNRGKTSIDFSSGDLSGARDNQRDQAFGDNTWGSVGNGVYIDGDSNGNLLNNGIFIKGDVDTFVLDVPGGNPRYTITQGGVTTEIKYISGVGTEVYIDGVLSGSYTDKINGMIYVEGRISDIQGALGSDEQLTIAASSDVYVGGNIVYQDVAVGNNPPITSKTMLGLISWEKSVKVKDSLPSGVDVYIYGSIMAPDGEFTVENFDSINKGNPKLHLFGGMVTNCYGAMGLGNKGYDRAFHYDSRFLVQSPPFYPAFNYMINVVDFNFNPTWRETN